MKAAKDERIIGWLFLCCWITYLTAYLCRVNFSAAMNAIQLEKGFSTEVLGTVGAVFYAVYACGQLVNGYIGDRVRADRFMLLALAGTMLSNLGMGLAKAPVIMMVLWGVNGCFQSMFWSTIIRVLAQNIPTEKRASISSGIALAIPAGYLISWSVLGSALDGTSSGWYFWLPAALGLIPAIAWLTLRRKLSFEPEGTGNQKRSIPETVDFLRREGALRMVMVCLFHGLVKEGSIYWMPLLAVSMLKNVSPHTAVLLTPLANLLGILLARWLLQRVGDAPKRIIRGCYAAVLPVCAVLYLVGEGMWAMVLVALISGLCYANNSILMGFLPMRYAKDNMVASVVGVFDFAAYVGASISTYVLGRLLGSAGFAPVPLVWLASAAAVLVLLTSDRPKGTIEETNRATE